MLNYWAPDPKFNHGYEQKPDSSINFGDSLVLFLRIKLSVFCLQGIPAYDVVTIVDPPYVLPKNATGQHDGYIVELLALVAKQASFKYNLSVVSGTYGHQEPDGTWAGLIGKLQLSNSAQIAVGAIAKTPVRENAVKFSSPFHSSGISLLLPRPQAEDGMGEGLLLLMPFTASTWTLISLAFILVSVGLFLIGRYSPCEWSRVSAENDVRRARYSFGLRNSFLFAISTFTWQGYREAPKSLSGRVVAVSWWCFTLSILVAYTCNLTALVMSRPDRQPALSFRTYEDILRDRSIDVGIVRSSDVDLILRGSSENMATQMYEYVRSRHNWVRDLGEGLERMRDSQGKFALLLPSYTAEYLALRNCDLITYGNSLDPHQLRVRLHSWGNRIDSAILTLREDGQVHMLRSNWLRKGGFCTETDGSSLPVRRPDRGSKFVVMGPRDLAVPFLFLFLCGLVAGLVFTLEILHSKGT
ncbi:hypothetical protein BaRGS_00022206, partial [Batillaria attramentaria]